MSSPFSIFRKYAKELTVALIGLSMFAFIVLDMLRPEQLPVVIGALLGAILFFFVGKASGRRVIYTGVGMLAGAILGAQFTGFATPEAPVTIQDKPMDQVELNKLLEQRNMANQFIGQAQYQSMGEQALQMQGGGFRFGFGLEPRQDVVLGSVLRDIGTDLRVAVTDQVIGDFINEITQEKMTTKVYQETLDQMNVTGPAVYEAIRSELKAMLAYKLHIRHLNPTPADYWETFRRTQIQQELQVIPIATSNFIPEVNNDPTDTEIEEYFERFKDRLPGELTASSPGFRVPRKVNLEYLMADRTTLQDELAAKVEVADEEIEAFYEENKETYRNINAFPAESEDTAAPSGPEMTAPETNSTPAETEEPAESESPEPESTEPEATPEEAPAEEKPAEEKPTEKPAPEESATETEATPEPTPEATEEPQSSLLQSSSSALASVQDEAGSASDTAPAEAAAPAEEEEKPAAEEKPATEEAEAASETPAEETPVEETATEEVVTEEVEEFRPLDEDLRAEIREQLVNQKINKLMYEQLEVGLGKMQGLAETYREKSLEMQEKIQKENKDLTRDELNTRLQAELKPVRQEMTAALKKIAEETGLVYRSTGLVDIRQLSTPEEEAEFDPALEIGNSTRAASPDQTFSPNSDPVWYTVFQPQSDLKYVPFHTSGVFLDNNHYAYWKTEDVATHVPPLEGDVRKAVIAAIINDRAKGPALKRAQEVAEKIRNNDGKIAESITDMTVTGEEGSEKLNFIRIEPFSWLVEVSTRGQQSFAPQTQVQLNSNIEGLEAVGEEFMQLTFDGMEVGDVKVVPNSGGEIFYVVKVVSREPSEEAQMTTLYSSFTDSLNRSLRLQQFLGPSQYARSILEENQEVRQKYIQAIFDNYGVKFSQLN
ncbi:hypothetical protein Pla110_12470 [Polystyrenella longa]|uniref:Periplasmic folding chaperone n=1 Tax=Polystyrenella longa TaxID=2528007 RepID=A0A518CJY2_9PLAN|nr:hypothetical protein [Polystyrenella longa]QDU79536.1 hypothetical protein Pla110_12470 [Polystyrenella longa]